MQLLAGPNPVSCAAMGEWGGIDDELWECGHGISLKRLSGILVSF